MFIISLFDINCKNHKEPQYRLNSSLLHVTSNPDVDELNYVKKLVKKGADLECKNDFDMTPLLNAAYGKGDRQDYRYDDENEKKRAEREQEEEAIKIVKYLISKGADKSATDYKGNNALHLAAYGGRNKMVQTLLELGFSVNEQNKAGATPLIIAAASGSLETVKLLISKGADINHTTKENATALDIAKQYEHKEIADYLENLGVKESFAK